MHEIKQVFDMDAALMLYEARHIRERGVIAFTNERMQAPPMPFLGAVINPDTLPIEVPVRRLKQKVAAGADFIQTQLILDVDRFAEFMSLTCQEGIDRDAFIIAGVPVVISAGALKMLPRIPGANVPPDVMNRLESATDLRATGVELAREIMQGIRTIPGISGIHLMLFGSDHSVLKDIVHDLDDRPVPSGAPRGADSYRKERSQCQYLG